MYYAIFVFGFFLLLLIRDAQRVTYPLLFLWMILLWSDLWKYRKKNTINIMLLGFMVFFVIETPIGNQKHRKEDEKLSIELIALMKKYDYLYEPGISFPLTMNAKMFRAMLQNRLFDEKNWISNYIMPAGWMSRHPYFYTSHNISNHGVQRKYKNYHDFLLAEESAFIGSKTTNEEMNEMICERYDKLFGINDHCKHRLVTLDESKHFKIVKVICQNGKGLNSL
ncbi:hypothetical protein HCR_18850 [Hydrogenimonas cancrithermarum]|uniref:Uncharacterized protein n=1 Tax=Hydrogenimonas cancrithermarum TaxID=2993563 RepID=A0ABM8FMG1_9BACT|nr:hypothetical protein HCR_18850 [Hydrogenimonas cancrithermarum]